MRVAATLVIAVVSLACLNLRPADAAPRTYDDFNDGQLNTVLWEPVYADSSGPPTVVEQNGRLELEIPPGSCGDAVDLTVNSGVRSTCLLSGDFDIQVDFALLAWPLGSGVRLGLVVGADGVAPAAHMERASFTQEECGQYPCEVYGAHMSGGVALQATSDDSGVLRIVREGTSLAAYFWAGGSWQIVGTGSCTAGVLRIGLWMWAHCGNFSDQGVRVALDNMQINSGTGCDAPIPVAPRTWGQVKALYQ